jgi:hypothetical protein
MQSSMVNPARFVWWRRECGWNFIWRGPGTVKIIRSGGEVNDPQEGASGGVFVTNRTVR